MDDTERDILYERRGSVAIMTLNRPRVLNAFRQSTQERLVNLLDQAAADDAVRTVILTGAGRAFSSGIDLKELGERLDDDASGGNPRDRLEQTQDLTRRLVAHPKVVIAAVNGPAVGLGAEVCLATDLRLAAAEGSFAFPEVKRALFLTNGVTLLLPRIVGLSRAMEWLVTGETISARQAWAAGLVNDVVSQEQLLESALELAERIAENAPRSVRLVKRFLHDGYRTDLETVLHEEVSGVLECMRTHDYREGIEAFLSKRAPRYKGK
jgi:enoyl-CoA hydratase/carnithine racemase